MRIDYQYQAWAFVFVFGVGATLKTIADNRVSRATENLSYYTGIRAMIAAAALECEVKIHGKKIKDNCTYFKASSPMFEDLISIPPNH